MERDVLRIQPDPLPRLERVFSQGSVGIGQGGTALNYKRADLDEILGRNSSP